MAGSSGDADHLPDHGPRHRIHCGWPRDVLTWVLGAPSLVFFGGILGLFAGGGVGVLVNLLLEQQTIAVLCGLVAGTLVAVVCAREHFGVSGESHEFFDECLVSRLRNPWTKRGGYHTVRIAYDEIGTLSLLPGARVRIRFGIPSPSARADCVIRLPKLSAADQFDAMVEWIEAARPGHLFVAETASERHYSTPWSIAERFADLGTTTGTATIDSLSESGTLQAADTRLVFRFDGFSRIDVHRDAGQPPFLAAISEIDGLRPAVRIIDAGGLLLATTATARPAPHDTVRLEFEGERHLAWHTHTSEVTIDGEPVAQLTPHGAGGARLTFARELPVVLVTLVFLLCGLFRRHLHLADHRASAANSSA